MTLLIQKKKALNGPPVKQPPNEPSPQAWLNEINEIIEKARIEEIEKTVTGKQYLQETSKANKSLLCYTFNVEDEKDNPTGAERTICRKKGSGSIVFAWDSSKGNLLNDGAPKKK